MNDCTLRIEKLENGYEVEIRDPKISAENDKPSKKGEIKPWKDPWKSYAFSTDKEVIAFVTRHLASLPKSSQDDFNDAAEEAFKE